MRQVREQVMLLLNALTPSSDTWYFLIMCWIAMGRSSLSASLFVGCSSGCITNVKRYGAMFSSLVAGLPSPSVRYPAAISSTLPSIRRTRSSSGGAGTGLPGPSPKRDRASPPFGRCRFAWFAIGNLPPAEPLG